MPAAFSIFSSSSFKDRLSLNEELEKIEKAAGFSSPKHFRNETVSLVLRARANNNGNNPSWTSYEKLRSVIAVSYTHLTLPTIYSV